MKHEINLVETERVKQINLGYTIDHDKKVNHKRQLSQAASWIVQYDDENFDKELSEIVKPDGWDLKYWLNLCQKPYKERLKIAAALIIAEMERVE